MNTGPFQSEPYDYIDDPDACDAMYERVEELIRSTPPRCLSGFLFDQSQKANVDDVFRTWSLRCACGQTHGKVLGYSGKDRLPGYQGDEVFLSPLAYECTSCTTVTEIIDTAKHGYEAEICNDPTAAKRGEGPRQVFQCDGCGRSVFECDAIFGYSHFDYIEDEPELEPKAIDGFDSFACRGTCTNCGKSSYFCSYELA